MFRGFSTVSLDAKGRLAVPSRYRERLAERAAGHLVVTPNPLDPSLWLYPLPEWEVIEAKLHALSDFDRRSRRTKQMMRGYACDCELDTQGRVLLPAVLRELARLDKDVVVLGQGNKLEVWDAARWNEQREEWLRTLDEEQGEPSETLGGLSL